MIGYLISNYLCSISFLSYYISFWPFSVENIFVTRIPSTRLCEHSDTTRIGASKVVTIGSWMVYGYTQVTMLNMGHMNKENNSDIKKIENFFSSSKHFTCLFFYFYFILSCSNYIFRTQKTRFILYNMKHVYVWTTIRSLLSFRHLQCLA